MSISCNLYQGVYDRSDITSSDAVEFFSFLSQTYSYKPEIIVNHPWL